jgi:8-oxo-dGTP diphosphatase
MPSVILVVAGLIEREGEILLTDRPPGSWMEGYWEFPGGKVNPEEDPREALARELVEELGIVVEVGTIEEVLHHAYPDKTVLLLFYWCRLLSEEEPRGLEGQQLAWAGPEDLDRFTLLPADRPLVERLKNRGIIPRSS